MGPPQDIQRPQSLGLSLVSVLAGQLNGQVSTETGGGGEGMLPGGVKHRLVFPLGK